MKWPLPRPLFNKMLPATINGKLTLWFFIFSLGPVSTIGIMAYHNSRAGLEKEITNKLDAVADNKAFFLKERLERMTVEVKRLASNPTVKSLLAPAFSARFPGLTAKTPEERTQTVKSLLTTLQETNPSYVDILIADKEGKVVVSSFKAWGQEGKNLSEIGLPKIDMGQAFVSPVFFSPIAQRHVFMVASPVSDHEGNGVGLAMLEIELKHVQQLIGERSGLGETGEVIIIDREQRMLTQSRFGEESTILKSVPETDPVRLGLQGSKGESHYKDYRGVPVLGSFRPLPEMAAVLIAKIDEAEGFAPIVKLRNTVLAVIIVTILIFGWVSVTIARTISRPIREGVGFAHRVAQGDLTVALPAQDTSEMGLLAISLNKMVEDLNQIVVRITEVVRNTGTAASQISAAAEEQERTVASQAAAINQITTTIQELAQSSNQVGKTAEELAEQWKEASRTTGQGNEAVQKGIEEMNRLKTKAEGIAQNILKLSEHIQRIRSIVQTVSNIAEQTNMLALNAAIEAARAGEHGRGFAVVATEVRKLADQSQKAATQIGAIIQEIQTATQSTILAVEEGNKGVEEGVRQVLQAGETLQGVTSTIKGTVGSVQEITLATRQQAIGADQLSEAMRSIDQGMKETVMGTKQTNIAASQLLALGRSLQDLVKRFRITEESHFKNSSD